MSGPSAKWARNPAVLLAVVLTASACLHVILLNPDRFGFFHDDGIYAVTARALATGEGYRIISLPYEPAQTKYPPLYPALLAAVWRVFPQFPDNVGPMMLLSVVASISFLALSWRYMVREGYATGWQALIAVGLAALNWRTMIVGTRMFSEMIYAVLAVAALVLAERYATRGLKMRPSGVMAGLTIGLALLTRTAGVSLLAATAAFFLLRSRKVKSLVAVSIAGLMLAAWIGWSFANRNEAGTIDSTYYTSYVGDFNQIIGQDAEGIGEKLGSFSRIVAQNVFMLLMVSVPTVILGLDYNWVLRLGKDLLLPALILLAFGSLLTVAGFARQARAGLRLLHLYIAAYFGLHLLWPYTSYDRFLMPLLPFLILFMLIEIQTLAGLTKGALKGKTTALARASAVFLSLFITVLAAAALIGYGSGLWRSFSSIDRARASSREDAAAFDWIKANTEPSDVLICYRDPAYYLHTGRKATRSFLNIERVSSEDPEVAAYERARVLFKIIHDNGGRYLVLTPSDFDLEYNPELFRQVFKTLVDRNGEIFVPVFQSTDGGTSIYRIDGGEPAGDLTEGY